MNQNNKILDFCDKAGLGMKQYLATYTNQQQWKAHFGARWETFERRKRMYDPLAILAPGQRIFPKASLPMTASAM
jgi:cytokinin dehydrogenase